MLKLDEKWPAGVQLADAARSAAAGAVSGSTVAVVLQPFDVLRTRLQTDATAGSSRPVSQTLRAIANEGGGISNLWRGSSATLVRVGAGAGVHFFTLQLMREAYGSSSARGSSTAPKADQGRGGPGTWLRDAGMGGASRSVAVLLLCPVTTVKTRMEASGAAGAKYAYRSVPHALTTIAQAEGISALWRGLLPALAANAPFSAIHYMCYRQIQAAAAPYMPSQTAANFFSGAVASLVATVSTQPFDVIRTRAMLRMAGPEAGASRFTLLAGIGPRLAKRCMQTSLLWTFYEELYSRWKRPSDGARSATP